MGPTLADSEPAKSMMLRKDRVLGCMPRGSEASGRGELSSRRRRMVWLRLLSVFIMVALVCTAAPGEQGLRAIAIGPFLLSRW